MSKNIFFLIPNIYSTEMKFLLMVLGTVLFIEGLPYFAFPSTVKKMMAEIHSMDNSRLRLMGLLAMVGGLIAVWYATRLS